MRTENYDIILSGSGMAGLSLLYRALKEGVWHKEKILVIDQNVKDKNDRTWCFWQEKNQNFPFYDVVYHQWNDLLFFTNDNQRVKLSNGNYEYHMVRSIDFYKYIYTFLAQFDTITFACENIISVRSGENEGFVETQTATYKGRYIFNSVYTKPDLKLSDQYFLQHFKGVTIQTNQFSGDPAQMHLMDFRTGQEHGTTFFYVLPFSKNEIFLEYTIFSKVLLNEDEYDSKIRQYLSEILQINDYKIIESEFGVIPMTDYNFKRRSGNVINLGSAGGDTRASSGYTFTNTQKTITKILESFSEQGHPFFETEHISRKHKLLDATILKVLDNNHYQGHQIFSDLFQNAEGKTVFAFLDAESTMTQDLKIMSSLKAKYFIGPFLIALIGK